MYRPMTLLAAVFALAALDGCSNNPFVGPSTAPRACPNRCPDDGLCCGEDQTCVGGGMCRDEDPWPYSAAQDAGPPRPVAPRDAGALRPRFKP